jgi:hypothetical protein
MSIYKDLILSLPLTDIPVAGGTAFDNSGEANNFSNYGGVVTSGGAALFNNGYAGTTTLAQALYAWRPNHPAFDTGNYITIAMDVNFESLSPTRQTLMASWGDVGFKSFALCYFSGNLRSQMSIDGTSTSIVYASTSVSLSAGTWYRVIMWLDGTQLGLRVGATENVAACAYNLWHAVGADPVSIGHCGSFYQFEGSIKNVMVWRRSLTADERATVAGGWTPEAARTGPINVALLFGQSNAAGLSNYSLLQYPTVAELRRKTLTRDGAATTPYWAPTSPGLKSDNYAYMGPEVGMSLSLGDTWAIAKYGVNSTGVNPALDHWYPGDPTHAAAIAATTKGLAELVSAGYVPTVKAIVWVAGEKDGETEAHALSYAENLAVLIADLRARYGHVPFIIPLNHISQVAAKPYIETIIAQCSVLQSAVDDVYLVDASEWGLTDDYHWYAWDMVRLGSEIGESILAAQSVNAHVVTFQDASITSSTFDGETAFPLATDEALATNAALATAVSGLATAAGVAAVGTKVDFVKAKTDTIVSGDVTIVSAINESTLRLDLSQHADYAAANGGTLSWTNASGTWCGGDITGQVVTVVVATKGVSGGGDTEVFRATGAVVAATGTQAVSVALTGEQTALLTLGGRRYWYTVWLSKEGVNTPVAFGDIVVVPSPEP